MRSLLLLLALPCLAAAAEPVSKISGPETVKPGTAIVVDARESVSEKPLAWAVTHKNSKGLAQDVKPLKVTPEGGAKDSIVIVLNAEEGQYDFTVVAVAKPEGAKDETLAVKSWTVAVPADPPVSPEPLVPPSESSSPAVPAPTLAGTLYVSFVYDQTTLKPDFAEILAGKEIQKLRDLLNFHYRSYEITTPEFVNLRLLPYIRGHTDANRKKWPKINGPALIIQNQKGDVISVEQAPSDSILVIRKVLALRLE